MLHSSWRISDRLVSYSLLMVFLLLFAFVALLNVPQCNSHLFYWSLRQIGLWRSAWKATHHQNCQILSLIRRIVFMLVQTYLQLTTQFFDWHTRWRKLTLSLKLEYRMELLGVCLGMLGQGKSYRSKLIKDYKALQLTPTLSRYS